MRSPFVCAVVLVADTGGCGCGGVAAAGAAGAGVAAGGTGGAGDLFIVPL